MRISAGSRGSSRNGGNIHVHPEIPFITIQTRIKRPISQSIPLASLEIRHAVFQELIRISPASNYLEELITGPGGLLSRGLLEDHATRYGARCKHRHPMDKRELCFPDCILCDSQLTWTKKDFVIVERGE